MTLSLWGTFWIGGQFLIWDVSVPQRPEGEERNYLVLVMVTVKDREVDTGCGQLCPEEEHDMYSTRTWLRKVDSK